MFAISLTYHQVLGIVRDMDEAERLVIVGGPAGRSYYRGHADAFRRILSVSYSDEEIAEFINEVNNNEKGAD